MHVKDGPPQRCERVDASLGVLDDAGDPLCLAGVAQRRLGTGATTDVDILIFPDVLRSHYVGTGPKRRVKTVQARASWHLIRDAARFYSLATWGCGLQDA